MFIRDQVRVVPLVVFEDGSTALYTIRALGGTVEKPIRQLSHLCSNAINENQDGLAVAFRVVPVPFVGGFEVLTSRFAREHS